MRSRETGLFGKLRVPRLNGSGSSVNPTEHGRLCVSNEVGRFGVKPKEVGRFKVKPTDLGRSGAKTGELGGSGVMPKDLGRSADIPRDLGRSGVMPREVGRSRVILKEVGRSDGLLVVQADCFTVGTLNTSDAGGNENAGTFALDRASGGLKVVSGLDSIGQGNDGGS